MGEIKGSNLPVFTRRKHLNLGFRPSFKFSKTEALLLEEQKRELHNDIQPVTVWDRCVLSGQPPSHNVDNVQLSPRHWDRRQEGKTLNVSGVESAATEADGTAHHRGQSQDGQQDDPPKSLQMTEICLRGPR